MVIVLSLVLCLILLVAVVAVLMPELVLPVLKKLWRKQTFYINSHDVSR